MKVANLHFGFLWGIFHANNCYGVHAGELRIFLSLCHFLLLQIFSVADDFFYCASPFEVCICFVLAEVDFRLGIMLSCMSANVFILQRSCVAYLDWFWKNCRRWYLWAYGHVRSFKWLVYVSKALQIKTEDIVLLSKKNLNVVLSSIKFLTPSPEIHKSKGIL